MSTISSRFSYGEPGVHGDRNGDGPRRCCFAQHSGAWRLTRHRESGTLPNRARTDGQRTRRGADCREPVDNCGGFAGGTLDRRNRKPQLATTRRTRISATRSKRWNRAAAGTTRRRPLTYLKTLDGWRRRDEIRWGMGQDDRPGGEEAAETAV